MVPAALVERAQRASKTRDLPLVDAGMPFVLADGLEPPRLALMRRAVSLEHQRALPGGVEPPRARFGGAPPDPPARAWHPWKVSNLLPEFRRLGTVHRQG